MSRKLEQSQVVNLLCQSAEVVGSIPTRRDNDCWFRIMLFIHMHLSMYINYIANNRLKKIILGSSNFIYESEINL